MTPELREAICQGIARAESAAQYENWYWDLMIVVPTVLARKGIGSTVDAVDFWDELRSLGHTEFKHMSAIGAVMRRLAKAGVLSYTKRISPRHTDGHGFHVEWRIEKL